MAKSDELKAISLRIDPAVLDRVDAYAAAHRPRLTRQQAMEWLLLKALDAESDAKAKDK